jgi:hypothetical protein
MRAILPGEKLKLKFKKNIYTHGDPNYLSYEAGKVYEVTNWIGNWRDNSKGNCSNFIICYGHGDFDVIAPDYFEIVEDK